MDMGERIKEERLKKGLTMEQLGDMLGVGRSAINKWEKGYVQNIKRSIIKKLCEIFDCTPSYLMGWDENPENEYYLNEETAKEAQRVFSDPDTRMLFDAARNSKPENIRIAADLLKRLKESNPDG